LQSSFIFYKGTKNDILGGLNDNIFRNFATNMIIIGTILAYFCILLLISRVTGGKADNEAFFRANGKSPWYLVAFGMIGASISGVTFVSVPGMVMVNDMSYMQTCLGFILGYFAVAYLLLPVYYRLRLTTIYSYLQTRLGNRSYKTGASFFLLSKMAGAAVRFYVVCMILQRFVLDAYGVPFAMTVVVLVLLIWLYTRHGGIRTLVLTDTFQTVCMFLALLLIIYKVIDALGLDIPEAVQLIASNSHSRIFVFDDWFSQENFWKQFLSGIFIVIVMTGLDQDMMQKNLTCKNLHEAQKDMCSYGIAFVPANFLFLSLGVLLMLYFQKTGQTLPTMPDELMLQAAASGQVFDGELESTCFVGELSLDGKINPCKGILAILLEAKEKKFKNVIIPKANMHEAELVDGINIYTFGKLADVVNFVNKKQIPDKIKHKSSFLSGNNFSGSSTKGATIALSKAFKNALSGKRTPSKSWI